MKSESEGLSSLSGYIEVVVGQVRRLKSMIGTGQSDPSVRVDRSTERYRRVVLTATGSLAARGVTALTMLVSVPLTVGYLGAERYGMWMTISSLITFFSFVDLGIGNGLVNSIADARGGDDREKVAKAVSGSFFLLLGIALLLLATAGIAAPTISLVQVFRVTSDLAVSELGPSVSIFLVCFLLNLPLSVVEKVRMGYQEGFANSVWQVAGSVGGLLLVLLAIRLEAGLPWLVVGMAGAPVLAMAGNALHQFCYFRTWLRPRYGLVDRATLLSLARIGSQFLVIQLLTAVGLASDNLIIAQIEGPEEVTGYAVVQKLYSLALLPQFLVAPLWPAFGEALARQDYAWAQRALVRSVTLSVLLACLIAIPLLFTGRFIIASWAGTDLIPSPLLLGGFTCQMILGAYGGAMTAFLNSSQALRRQTCFYGLAAVTAILLKIALVTRWKTAGVAWGTVVAFGLFYAIPAGVLARRVLRQS